MVLQAEWLALFRASHAQFAHGIVQVNAEDVKHNIEKTMLGRVRNAAVGVAFAAGDAAAATIDLSTTITR